MAGSALQRQRLVLLLAPAAQQALGHAHGLQHLRVAQRPFHVARCAARFLLHRVQRLAAHPVVEPGQADHHDGGACGTQAQRRVEEGDDGHVDHDPRRIHERRQSVGREQAPQRRDVAHRVRPCIQRRTGGGGDDRMHHRRREPLVDDVAAQVLQPKAHVVQHEQDGQRSAYAGQQHPQRLAAVGGNHPVEHLQHEQRRHQVQQIDDEREKRHVEQQWLHLGPDRLHVLVSSSMRSKALARPAPCLATPFRRSRSCPPRPRHWH